GNNRIHIVPIPTCSGNGNQGFIITGGNIRGRGHKAKFRIDGNAGSIGTIIAITYLNVIEARNQTTEFWTILKGTSVQAVLIIPIPTRSYIGGQDESNGIVITDIIGRNFQYRGYGSDNFKVIGEHASIGIGHGIGIVPYQG